MSEEAPTVEPISEQTIGKLFRYSSYVHVGAGAEDCESREDGQCTEPGHFHAWVALPNQFQQESLRQKALAARARMQRALRDPATDACAILDAEIDELRETATVEQLINFIVAVDEPQTRLAVMRELEEPGGDWEHRSEDVLRERELSARDDLEPSEEDELAMLGRESVRYVELMNAKLTEVEAPRRSALGNLEQEGLLKEWREKRILQESAQAFSLAYSRQEWYVCTFKPTVAGTPTQRMYSSHEELAYAAPEVMDALQGIFRELEMSLQRQLSGNW